MGEPEIKFGDKLFLYGQYLNFLEEFESYEYNSVMGYMTIGGYELTAIETNEPFAAVGGYIVDAGSIGSLAFATPFLQAEMTDVTDKLSLSLPLPVGCRVWMPTTKPH